MNFALALLLVGAEAYYGCVYSDTVCGATPNCSTFVANTCIPDIFFSSGLYAYINCTGNPTWSVGAFQDGSCTMPIGGVTTGANETQCVDASLARLKLNCDAAAVPPTPNANSTSAPTPASNSTGNTTSAPTAAPPASSSAAVLGLTAASLGLMFL